MQTIKHPKLIAILIFILCGVTFAFVSFSLSDQGRNVVTETEASQPMTEIKFDPSQYMIEEGEEASVKLFIDPNTPTSDPIDYINLKLEYDPEKLEAIEVKEGDFPGIYQNSILVDTKYQPVGMISILWIPQPGSDQLSSISSIANLIFKTTSPYAQVMKLSQVEDPNDWRSNVVLTSNKTYIPIKSEGLSINGGERELSNLENDTLLCSSKCGNGELCINGKCEIVAYVESNLLSMVLGASSEKIVIEKGDVDLNGKLNVQDVSLLLSDLKVCESTNICNPRSDLNEDGIISVSDYYQLIKFFGE